MDVNTLGLNVVICVIYLNLCYDCNRGESLMKLIIIITSDEYVGDISAILLKHKFRATEVGNTGDFLQYGNTVLLLGVQEEHCDEVIKLLKKEYNTTINKKQKNGDIILYVVDAGTFLQINPAIPHDLVR